MRKIIIYPYEIEIYVDKKLVATTNKYTTPSQAINTYSKNKGINKKRITCLYKNQ